MNVFIIYHHGIIFKLVLGWRYILLQLVFLVVAILLPLVVILQLALLSPIDTYPSAVSVGIAFYDIIFRTRIGVVGAALIIVGITFAIKIGIIFKSSIR